MVMSLSTLAVMGKIQKNICTKVRPVDLINKKTQSNNKHAAIYESGLYQ